MTAFLPLFRVIGHQLLIVALVLLSLPIVIRILWKLRLLPLGCYFVATKLFWPRWAAAHETVCILLFIACMDHPFHPQKARGENLCRRDPSLRKRFAAGRIQNA